MRLAMLLLLLGATAASAGEAKLELLSGGAFAKGRQMESPLWAPGDSPKLVFEANDRHKSSILRVAELTPDGTLFTTVPGANSSRMERLGAGSERADTRAAWLDGDSFFFVRAEGQDNKLYYFESRAIELQTDLGLVNEVAIDRSRKALYVSAVDGSGADLYRVHGEQFGSSTRLSTTADPESAIAIDEASGRVAFVQVGQPLSSLRVVEPGADSSGSHPAAALLRQFELIGLTAVDGSEDLLAYARVPAGAPESEARHVLVEVAKKGGSWTVTELAGNCMVPPGQAPAPAISHRGRYVYFILKDETQGNPVMRFDRSTSKTERLSLPTSGHQEVAIGEYPHAGGGAQVWIAVIAVGGVDGEDQRNHLYAGTLDP
jgi:hypothetical protein